MDERGWEVEMVRMLMGEVRRREVRRVGWSAFLVAKNYAGGFTLNGR